MLTTFSLQQRLKKQQTNNNKSKGRQTSNGNGYCPLRVLFSSSYTIQTCHMYNRLGSICNNHKSKCRTIKDPHIPITHKDQFLSLSTNNRLVFNFYDSKKRNHPGPPLIHVSLNKSVVCNWTYCINIYAIESILLKKQVGFILFSVSLSLSLSEVTFLDSKLGIKTRIYQICASLTLPDDDSTRGTPFG